MNAPKSSHKGLAVSAAITCQHVCSLLSKKNLFLTFDDTNGIGTARYLLEQALQNTGWTLKYCETFYETDILAAFHAFVCIYNSTRNTDNPFGFLQNM